MLGNYAKLKAVAKKKKQKLNEMKVPDKNVNVAIERYLN